MMSATDANLLRSKIDKAVMNLGNGNKLPQGKSNTDGVALQYWLWSYVAKMVDNMRKQATREAVKVGVIFDPEKDPQEPGTEKIVYNGSSVVVTLKVATPSTRVDADDLVRALRKAGVKQSVLDNAIEEATKQNRAPHRFTANLVEKPE